MKKLYLNWISEKRLKISIPIPDSNGHSFALIMVFPTSAGNRVFNRSVTSQFRSSNRRDGGE